jgi:hypothetical protein
VLAVLAVCAGSAGAVFAATATTDGCGGQCLTIAPAGGNTFQVTVTVASRYATITSFQLQTGNPTTNWSPRVCTSAGTATSPDNPEAGEGTFYLTNCHVTVKPGASVNLCFDGSGEDGGYIPNGFGTPTYTPYWATPASTTASGDGDNVVIGPAVSRCTPSKITPPKCVVPNVKGIGLVAAKQLIVAANCKVGKIKRVKAKHAIVTGIVVSQNPRAGSKGPKNKKVNLVVTKR